jgi:aminomethyltransferase
MATEEQSVLHARHEALGARFVEVAGRQMPLSYRIAIDETQQLLDGCGVVDVSHHGRIRIRGDGALALLERACAQEVARQEDDTAAASLMLTAGGGVLDLGELVRLEDAWLMVTSPPCRQKVLNHLRELATAEGLEVKLDDQSDKTVQLLVAGPQAPARLDAVLPFAVSQLADGAAAAGSMMLARYSGYRRDIGGLWAMHVVLPGLMAGLAWDFITQKAGANIVAPAGLAAVDAARVQAGVPAYGAELNETIDPVTAGLSHLCRAEGGYIGAEALAQGRSRAAARRLVRLAMDMQAPHLPRLGEAVLDADGVEAGAVTSSAYWPPSGALVLLAYVDVSRSGGELYIDTPQGRVRLAARQ